jgi:hypothetical protein
MLTLLFKLSARGGSGGSCGPSKRVGALAGGCPRQRYKAAVYKKGSPSPPVARAPGQRPHAFAPVPAGTSARISRSRADTGNEALCGRRIRRSCRFATAAGFGPPRRGRESSAGFGRSLGRRRLVTASHCDLLKAPLTPVRDHDICSANCGSRSVRLACRDDQIGRATTRSGWMCLLASRLLRSDARSSSPDNGRLLVASNTVDVCA